MDTVNIPPVTTKEEDKHTQSQRNINKIWEFTQSFISIAITLSFIASILIESPKSADLSGPFLLIVGFYFGRTNHQTVGGVQIGR